MPCSSRGRSMPVGVPKPKRRIQSYMPCCCRASSPIFTAPMLLDCARICDVVSVSVGWNSESWMTRSATWYRLGDGERGRRRDQPVRQRAADRHDLERRPRLVVEPGGVVLRQADLRRVVGVDARPVGHREDRVGPQVEHDRGGVACSRICAAVAASTLSVYCCSAASRVSCTVWPATGPGPVTAIGPTMGVEHGVLRPGGARELPVELELESARPPHPGADAAEHLGRRGTCPGRRVASPAPARSPEILSALTAGRPRPAPGARAACSRQRRSDARGRARSW